MSLDGYWPSLFAVFGASLIAFLSPGPNFVGIVSSAVVSRLNGLFVAVGVSLGTAFWAIMAVTGITALLSRYSGAAFIMQIIGGSYLLWLGLKSLQGAMKTSSAPTLKEAADETPLRSFWKGLFIQLTNPKPALFWLSMVSVVLDPNAPLLVGVVLVLGVTLIAFAWHFTLALAFSIGHTRSFYVRARRAISLSFGILFIVLGGRLILWNVAGV